MYFDNNYAVIIPLANEAVDFPVLAKSLQTVLNRLQSGTVYFVVDHVSKDNTKQLVEELEKQDDRFKLIWAPENKNVVDAYLNGYKAAIKENHDFFIEMDGGLSHDPRALPMFLRVLNEGNQCAFGSRFINGGSTADSAWKRKFLSKFGTTISNILLDTKMKDTTSGYQGFHRNVVEAFLAYGLRSKAHFYQTELRYLLRNTRYMEVPIHYRAPSPSVSKGAIKNSLEVLMYYFMRRITRHKDEIDVDFKVE
jgi:dolichol-phosphate mannosyltransferase